MCAHTACSSHPLSPPPRAYWLMLYICVPSRIVWWWMNLNDTPPLPCVSIKLKTPKLLSGFHCMVNLYTLTDLTASCWKYRCFFEVNINTHYRSSVRLWFSISLEIVCYSDPGLFYLHTNSVKYGSTCCHLLSLLFFCVCNPYISIHYCYLAELGNYSDRLWMHLHRN